MSIDPDIEKIIKGICDDRTHGASELARHALEALRLAAVQSRAETAEQFRTEQNDIGRRLMSVRPSMAPIYNAVQRLMVIISENKIDDIELLRQTTISQIDILMQASVHAISEISSHTTSLISDKDVIFTHSYSSTVAAALKAAYKSHQIQVIVTRSGIRHSGERVAWELSYDGIQVTFIDDTAIGLYIAQANKVIVGADRICVDGGQINGIGTYLLALAAKKVYVPFYVLCETLKFDSRLTSADVELEEKDPFEVAAPGTLPEGVNVKNPYFDITPPDLITGFITEDGLIKASEISSYMEKLTA